MQNAPDSSPVAPGPRILDERCFGLDERRRLSAAGLRTFLAIADLWNLAEPQRLAVLGSPSRSTYYGWVKNAREHRDFTLSVDTLTRISAVLGIYQALRILYPTEAHGVAWLKSPNRFRIFGGREPMVLLASGPLDALITLRRHLDAARGGIFTPPNEIDRDFRPYKDDDIEFCR